MRNQLTDAHIRLLRGVRAVIAADSWFDPWMSEAPDAASRPSPSPSLVIEDFASEPWASLTFCGMRHRLDIRLSGPAPDVETAYRRLRSLLDEPAIELPGHFVAELQLTQKTEEFYQDGHMGLAVQIEALTIEE